MDFRLLRIHENATANIYPDTDQESFCELVKSGNFTSIVQTEDRIRIEDSEYRFITPEAAKHMAILLAEYTGSHGMKVRISRQA